MSVFDFFYDLGSPYSYLAATQLSQVAARTGKRPRLLPITLGGLRKSTGAQMPPPLQLQYMVQDTQRWAQKYGVPLSIPQAFPTKTVQALRTCIAAEAMGGEERAMLALFRAYWAEGKDLVDAGVIAEALDGAGLDGKALVVASETQEVKDALRRNTDLALARGVFGVPTIFVGERSFWGNDRLQFVEDALEEEQ